MRDSTGSYTLKPHSLAPCGFLGAPAVAATAAAASAMGVSPAWSCELKNSPISLRKAACVYIYIYASRSLSLSTYIYIYMNMLPPKTPRQAEKKSGFMLLPGPGS